jgi:hypothetical protein
MTLRTYYPGETMRLSARNLTHADSGSVTSGATVTIAIYAADGALSSTNEASTGGSGDDWYVDVAAPATPGTYTVRITATKDGAVWKGKGAIRVETF